MNIKLMIKQIIKNIFPSLCEKILLWRFQRNNLPAAFVNHLSRLRESDTVMDLGANVGMVTQCLAKTGAQVYSFEPNKAALVKLRRSSSKFSNVQVYSLAAGVKDRNNKLYLHQDTATSNRNLTQSSSLIAEKPNVSKNLFQEVEEIDFSRFILSLNKQIELVKMDIEGFEIQVLNRLIDTKAIYKINYLYIETHERISPELKEQTAKLINRVHNEGIEKKFFFDWQ